MPLSACTLALCLASKWVTTMMKRMGTAVGAAGDNGGEEVGSLSVGESTVLPKAPLEPEG